MRDNEPVTSIGGDDPLALEDVYGKYVDLLWSYCLSMLSDADDAAEAVLDTFVIAASQPRALRTMRLRAWLYAVARDECLRRLRSSRVKAASRAPRLGEVAAAALSASEQWQLRAVLQAAFCALDDAERDVMTMVWHGLGLAEVAVVLGVSRSDACALFTRARDQLEESVGVLLVGWSGRRDCPGLDGMLSGNDRRLTPDLRARLSRHIGRCGVCASRHHHEMRPALRLGLSMGALLGEADAPAVAGLAPAGLWEEVWLMTFDRGPRGAWRRALGGRRVVLGDNGFPKPVSASRDSLLTAPRVAAAAVGTMAVAAVAIMFTATGHHAVSGGKRNPASSLSAVVPGDPPVKVMIARSAPGASARTTPSGSRSGLMSPSSVPMTGSSPVTGTTGTTTEPAAPQGPSSRDPWPPSAAPPGSPPAGPAHGSRQPGGWRQPGGSRQPGGPGRHRRQGQGRGRSAFM